MNVNVGVDSGATNLRVGVVDEQGNLLVYSKRPSPLKSQPEQLAKMVKGELADLASQDVHLRGWNIKGVGIGTPGPLDLGKGLILPSSNLGNTQPIDLKTQFDTEFNLPIYFDRDTNLALLGEAWKGVAVGKKDVVMLTLGSGVGGALMIDGKIERGASGKAGEIGHILLPTPAGPVTRQPQNLPTALTNAGPHSGAPRLVPPAGKPSNYRCGLGHENCLEALITSAQNLEELATYLGYGLANIVDIFNPQMIIIGGGKLNEGDFLPQAVQVMKEVGMKEAVDEVEVVYAKLGDKSGVYGGAKLAYDSSPDQN